MLQNWVECSFIFFLLFHWICIAEPAIRVVDEQGNEVHDRYYKIGSTIDLTCQVATTFITKNSTSTVEPGFSLLQKHTNTLPTAATTLYPPPISAFSVLGNDIDESEQATLRSAFNDSLFKRIRWTKDGEKISKDALFNLRWVRWTLNHDQYAVHYAILHNLAETQMRTFNKNMQIFLVVYVAVQTVDGSQVDYQY